MSAITQGLAAASLESGPMPATNYEVPKMLSIHIRARDPSTRKEELDPSKSDSVNQRRIRL